MQEALKQLKLLCGKKALGSAMVQDYTEWATNKLADGVDTPNLRILAGLLPEENLSVAESHFAKALVEMKIGTGTAEFALYEYADAVAQDLATQKTDSRRSVTLLYKISEKLNHPKVMAYWVYLFDALAALDEGSPPSYYPVPPTITLENLVEVCKTRALEYLADRKKRKG